MASVVLSSIQSLSTKLLEAIRGTTSDKQDLVRSVIKDLEKLTRMVSRIQAVQQDAEEREIHDRSVRLWLSELRGVANQADDVLDDFYYEVLRFIVESGDAAIEAFHRGGGVKRKLAEMYTSSSLASYPFTITKVAIPDGMAEKIKGIIEMFEEISHDLWLLHLREEDGTRLVISPRSQPPTSSCVNERAIFDREEDGTRLVISPRIQPPTSSCVNGRAIFDREEEKEKIISLLNPTNGPDFMVLPIVGKGGLGKTTLAQLVYNDSRICWLFNKRCWVSVHEHFDLVRLTKDIVDLVSDSPCESSELSKLQDVLKEKIRGLGLFLVLDDVWIGERNLWECFRVGFFGAKFVRILTTIRNTSVSKVMQATSPFQLGSLHEENCWLLFKHSAFGNMEASDNTNLYEIGRGIVKKCKGVPLAIKALGGILRYEMDDRYGMDEEKWRKILESDISEIDETGEIMPALRLSYQKLPRHIKPCFLYLSMFPKGKRFEKDMMVRLWMAQGYINGNTQNLKTLEEIGSEYFDELQGRSLIEVPLVPREKSSTFLRDNLYQMHDLIHDLARSISQEAYQLVFENDQQCNGPYKVYHLNLTEQDKSLGCFLAPSNCGSIRTFVNECPTEMSEFLMFSGIASVRALQLRYFSLPNTLHTLKHLRYLYVQDSQMEVLPETLCLLYNLQTLDLNSYHLRELPENIKNLINLRYFQLNSLKIQQLPESIFLLRNLHTLLLGYCSSLKELPRGIEQLTRLRILDVPVLRINMSFWSGITTLESLSGHFRVMDHGMIGGLGDIKHMNKLSGLLCITGLRNISDVEHSRNANLASKPNLHKLNLNFQEDPSILSCRYKECHLHLAVCSSKNAKNENDGKIQHVVLESLKPHGNLTELAILNYGGRFCPSWLLNPLLPKLTTLTLDFCSPEPNFLPPFGQLPYLRFLEISSRTVVRNVGDELSTYSLLEEYGSSKQPKEPSYPSLEVLSLRNMLNLVEWQAHDGDFPHLKKLIIENCPKLWKISTIPQEVREVTFEYCPKLKFLRCSSVIRNVKINDCGFSEIMFQSISENLTISNCVELISINWIDSGLNSVREVSFKNCPKLELVTIPVGTLKLIINKCGFRKIMFQSVTEDLRISNCIELISIHWMDKGLNSIRAISFECCPKLEVVTIPVETLSLIINKCGLREIMFQSVSKYLRISNCIELISINWMDQGLNPVTAVSFEYCPKLELVTIPVGTSTLIINECGFRKIMFQSVSEYLTISNCIELISINWMDGGLNSVREVSFESCPKLKLQFPVKDVLHSMTQRAPSMDLGKRYVYQRDTTNKVLNLFGNNEIRLSSTNSPIPLLENPFALFLTKEDFPEVESLTCVPSVGVSCQCIMLYLPSLVVLEILRCRKVISVTGLDNLSNLKRLSISYCPELCNWNDKTLPLSLKSLELDSCDKLSSLPLLSVQNHSNTLNVLVIKKCPRLAVLEGFHSLMKLKIVKLLHCRNISISPATEGLQFWPLITTIVGCPLMREWCQRNSITYYELNPIDNPQDDREAEQESAGSTTKD